MNDSSDIVRVEDVVVERCHLTGFGEHRWLVWERMMLTDCPRSLRGHNRVQYIIWTLYLEHYLPRTNASSSRGPVISSLTRIEMVKMGRQPHYPKSLSMSCTLR